MEKKNDYFAKRNGPNGKKRLFSERKRSQRKKTIILRKETVPMGKIQQRKEIKK